MFISSSRKLVELLTPRRLPPGSTLSGHKGMYLGEFALPKDILAVTFEYKSISAKGSKEMGMANTTESDLRKDRVLKDMSYFKVLVAEDNLINQKIVIKMLEKMGIQFKVVNNGREVIESLRNEYFDLVLLDCYMSEMNGFETAGFIRNCKERFSKIPLIAFSAGLFATDSAESRKAGMDDFILKPVSYDVLRVKLQEWAGRIYESLPILDFSSLEKIRSFDDEHHNLLRSLFQIYSENTQEELYKMRDLILDGDMERIRKKAHMLKSSAAQLGALRFEKFCILMEHDEILDMDRARTLHAEMSYEYEKSRISFSQYCQSLSQIPIVSM
jgi:CheY-like chemotaxis protein/HPt (histidine-containing phosphotransfer) domain-containing protein